MKILKIYLICACFQTARGTYICPLGKKFKFICIKNKLRKYVIIRLLNLKLDTNIAHIETLPN